MIIRTHYLNNRLKKKEKQKQFITLQIKQKAVTKRSYSLFSFLFFFYFFIDIRTKVKIENVKQNILCKIIDPHFLIASDIFEFLHSLSHYLCFLFFHNKFRLSCFRSFFTDLSERLPTVQFIYLSKEFASR